MKLTTSLALGTAAGVVVLGALWYAKGRVGEAAGAIGNAVNPLNPDNVFYSGVNAAGAAITGDEAFSLGAWIWEATHPGQRAQERAATGSGATGAW